MLIILGQLKVGFYTTPLYSYILPVIESVHKIQILKSKTQL